MQKVMGRRLKKGFRRCSRGFLHMVKLEHLSGPRPTITSLPTVSLHQDYPLPYRDQARFYLISTSLSLISRATVKPGIELFSCVFLTNYLIPWTEEPGRIQPMGLPRFGPD